jgi:hypothetical protein
MKNSKSFLIPVLLIAVIIVFAMIVGDAGGADEKLTYGEIVDRLESNLVLETVYDANTGYLKLKTYVPETDAAGNWLDADGDEKPDLKLDSQRKPLVRSYQYRLATSVHLQRVAELAEKNYLLEGEERVLTVYDFAEPKETPWYV